MASGKGRAPGVAIAVGDCAAPGVTAVAGEDEATGLLIDIGELEAQGDLLDGNNCTWGEPLLSSVYARELGWETLTDCSMTAESALLSQWR